MNDIPFDESADFDPVPASAVPQSERLALADALDRCNWWGLPLRDRLKVQQAAVTLRVGAAVGVELHKINTAGLPVGSARLLRQAAEVLSASEELKPESRFEDVVDQFKRYGGSPHPALMPLLELLTDINDDLQNDRSERLIAEKCRTAHVVVNALRVTVCPTLKWPRDRYELNSVLPYYFGGGPSEPEALT